MPYCYVDLRSRKTGNTVETILTTENPDVAWHLVSKWNRTHVPYFDPERSSEDYIDGSDGLVADCYYEENGNDIL